MATQRVLRSRIAFWIYLVGIAQFVVVVAGFAAMFYVQGPPPSFHERDVRLVARLVEPLLSERGPLEERVALLGEQLNGCITVTDPQGRLVASSGPKPCTCAQGSQEAEHDEPSGARCRVAAVAFPNGGEGQASLTVQRARRGPPRVTDLRVIIFVLLVVGVSSWLLARWLTRPLAQLSKAAQAFGSGELSARTGIARSDELGDVGRAFDEMAGRITELLRTERELLANVSHELRTPLARVRVALDLAAEGDAETARESLAEIVADLDELERLIGDVLMAARLDLAGEGAVGPIPPMHEDEVGLTELLDHAVTRFRSAHPDRPIQAEIPEGLATVVGDPVLLRRLVENLLENAHKYTERPEEPIEIRARPALRGQREGAERRASARKSARAPAQPGVEIEVADRGIGIAPDDLPRVCEPFFRADRSRTRATGGLGLGLALARRIVDAHDGELEITSELGRGTCVRVWIPAREPDDRPSA